jgi:acyl phosphate:glycerol-3-phosphate acyltransferase
VFVLDALKGAVAAGWPLLFYLARRPRVPGQLAATWGYRGLAALLGHSFSCFTGFRGGKGVATAAGGLLVLMPSWSPGRGRVWAAVFYATRYVSLASILAALSLPVSALAFGRGGSPCWGDGR